VSTAAGQLAEAAAAEYLRDLGYEILERNWRTRWCEIDIIAAKDGTAHFIEVKYRRTPSAGTGLSYITPAKLKRMAFAAELWRTVAGWSGDSELGAVELSGIPPVVDSFIAELT